MGATLLHAVASLLTRLQRAARRMAAGAGGGGGKGSPRALAVVAPWKKTSSLAPSSGATKEAAEPGVWRKEILMGERCQPLDFADAVHYDSFRRRLARPLSTKSS